MINPSTTGWIIKLFADQKWLQTPDISTEAFYLKIRKSGLIYGHIISFDAVKSFETDYWTREEFCKVALLDALFSIYKLNTQQTDTAAFIERTIAFYDEINPEGLNWMQKVLKENVASVQLEKIIDDRVQTNENVVTKKFSPIFTNALLFEDILAYNQFLLNGKIPTNYLKNLEKNIVSIIALGLEIKTVKSKYDSLLTKLVQSSIRHTKFSETENKSLDAIEIDKFTSKLDYFYLIDLAGIALYNENLTDENEMLFLHEMAKKFGVSSQFVIECITDRNDFMRQHKHQIPYFNNSNPVKNFYDQATQTVTVLISRNKRRLLKELANNGELAVLLTQSTIRSLDTSEKKKVKKQLLEICKTIPSLTIFMLPGGSLLLPIFIKFIPKMLPSAFNENLED